MSHRYWKVRIPGDLALGPYEMWVVVTTSIEEYLEMFHPNLGIKQADAITIELDNITMVFPHSVDYGSISHEISHALYAQFKAAGKNHVDDSESLAYAMGYMTNIVISIFQQVNGNLHLPEDVDYGVPGFLNEKYEEL